MDAALIVVRFGTILILFDRHGGPAQYTNVQKRFGTGTVGNKSARSGPARRSNGGRVSAGLLDIFEGGYFCGSSPRRFRIAGICLIDEKTADAHNIASLTRGTIC